MSGEARTYTLSHQGRTMHQIYELIYLDIIFKSNSNSNWTYLIDIFILLTTLTDNLNQLVFLRSSRIRVDLLSYERKPTDKREQYDWRVEKNLDGTRFSQTTYQCFDLGKMIRVHQSAFLGMLYSHVLLEITAVYIYRNNLH